MLDRVIVSCDDSYFKEYVPIVSEAWKKFFPECDLSIAFITDRSQDDSLVKRMLNYGDVKLFKPVEGVPPANQAKISRHILASEFENQVCSIEDIDTVPLQREWYYDRLSKRKKGSVLAVGAEVFLNTPHSGKFPMSTITAEGDVFKQFINPNNLNYSDLVKSFIDLKIYDNKESINNHPNQFSDESLIRALLSRWEEKTITHVERNVDIRNEWIDRSWWTINDEKLHNGEYVTCNFLRPPMVFHQQIQSIANYIYDNEVSKEEFLLV
jgi:hypothetical protein